MAMFSSTSLPRLVLVLAVSVLLPQCERKGTATELGGNEPRTKALAPAAATATERQPAARHPAAAPTSPPAGTADAEPSAEAASEQRAEPKRKPDVHFVPTPYEVVDKMLDLARVTKRDLVYDLGCGDGRIVVAAAKRGARAVGFDIDPERVREARANVEKNGVQELVRIEEADIFALDLRPASVVTLYLLPNLNVRLVPQLEKLKPGSRIVSHDFDIEGVKPMKHVSVLADIGGKTHQVYLFTIPLKKVAKGASGG
jgi:precorrin-6B methylase 2